MKKLIYLIVLAVILGLVLTGCLLSNVGQVPVISQTKVKPEGLGGAQTYAWHLSKDVMPSPPYGLSDIPGSDTASKLIVNQPNGAVEVTITGAMNVLDPNTTYTVFLSKEYTENIPFNIVGVYKWGVIDRLVKHDMIINIQNPDGTFSGTGGYPAGSSPYTLPGQTSETITGQVIMGDQINITFTTTYSGPLNQGYILTVLGTIAPDGSMSGTNMSGTWEWNTTFGNVTLWPVLFTENIPAFTFTTDDSGSGSWHINLRDSDFTGPGSYTLSVWIDGAGKTILISDNFSVKVD